MRYEYRCKHCNALHEVEQRITEAPLEWCGECKQPSLQRLISGGGGFVLQGGGWYRDGYNVATKKDEK